MSQRTLSKPYLLDNNPDMDMLRLEKRLDEILADEPATPAAPKPLPSALVHQPPSILRRLLIKVKSSRVVSEWLPRHPVLYRRVRFGYHAVKRLVRR